MESRQHINGAGKVLSQQIPLVDFEIHKILRLKMKVMDSRVEWKSSQLETYGLLSDS